MTKPRFPYLGLSLVGLLFAFLAIWANPAMLGIARAETDDEARNRLDQINERSAVLERQIDELQNAHDLAHDELQDIDSDLSVLESRLAYMQNQLSTKQTNLDSLNQSHTQAVQDLDSAQTRFESRLVEWYEAGGDSVLGSLLTSGNLSNFMLAMSYTESIIQNDRATIAFIKEQKGRILEEKDQLDKEVAELHRLSAEMASQQSELDSIRERRYVQVTAIAGDVHRAEAELAALERSSNEITALLQASRYVGGAPENSFVWPIQGSITSGFGMRRHPILGGMRQHDGIDIPAPAGTPIHAAKSGLVVFSGWKRGYGYCVTIDHGNGLATHYAHCSQLLVNTGETVARGQVIAKVGTTGLSTGNHLHFEVRIHGEPVDPIPYLPAR
jgi:murein DD-endopeptidase MepM/ murein hydrolase activator NlpD